MRTLFFLQLILLSSFYNQSVAQTKAKPRFKTLEFAKYVKNKKGELSVTFYIKIDSLGKVQIKNNLGTSPHHYCFALPDSVIENLNTVFTRPMKSYMITDKIGSGTYYAGEYSFAAVHKNNKTTEYLTYIYPFMNDVFHDAEQSVYTVFYDKVGNSECDKFLINQTFVTTLKQYHLKAKNLPERELPPSQMPPPGM